MVPSMYIAWAGRRSRALSGCWVGHVRWCDEKIEIALSRAPFPGWCHQLLFDGIFRFQLNLRDIEELLFERGVTVTYETIRCWCDKFGKGFAHRVKAARDRKS